MNRSHYLRPKKVDRADALRGRAHWGIPAIYPQVILVIETAWRSFLELMARVAGRDLIAESYPPERLLELAATFLMPVIAFILREIRDLLASKTDRGQPLLDDPESNVYRRICLQFSVLIFTAICRYNVEVFDFIESV